MKTCTCTCTYMYIILQVMWPLANMGRVNWGGQPRGETWSARIRGKPLSQRPVLSSLIVYIYNEGRGEMADHLSGQRSLEEVYGHTPEVVGECVYVLHVCLTVCENVYVCMFVYVRKCECVSVCVFVVSPVQDVPAS